MAEIKPQVYKDPRPAEYFTRFHERARTRQPDWIYDLARILLTPPTMLFYRARPIGTHNVPTSGPVILASNHFSNWDHFFAGVFLRRKVRFMGKSQLFGANPALTYIFSHGGVFPVRRGHKDQEAFITAHTILRTGGCILIYVEGGRSRTGGLGEPRPGVGYVALESGVPVVPVAIHGSLGVRKWRKLRFPKVTVQYGEPMTFDVVERPSREQAQETAERIFEPVRDMYGALERQGRRDVIRALHLARRDDRGHRSAPLQDRGYRSRESNRTALPYPENYTEPELRGDRPRRFEPLESEPLDQEAETHASARERSD